MRLIDANVMIKRAAALEMEALDVLVKDNPTESLIRWHLWNAKLNERTMFKYDLVDAPVIDAVPVSFLEKLRENAQNDEAALMIDEIIVQWRKENAD